MLKPSATNYWSRLAHQTQLQVLFYAHESYFLIDVVRELQSLTLLVVTQQFHCSHWNATFDPGLRYI